MGIHQHLFSDSEHLPQELICPLCSHVLFEPFQVLCHQDHVFCKACLSNYVDECYQEQGQQDGCTETVPENPEGVDRVNVSDTQTPPRQTPQDTVVLHEDTTVECPECTRLSDPSGPLPIGSFRSTKFVERIIQAKRIRCPTTMAKSCQWSGALKDMEQHLDVCGFAVELWCPHHQLGCNYRGAALDIAAHLACCPFSPHEPSVVSESLDDLHVNESVSLRREPPSPPQSSPPIGTQGLHRHQGEAHSQDLIHHDADMDDQYAEAFRTPDLSNIPDDVFDVPEINDQPQKTDKADTSFDQEEFSELLGDLEMTDTTCPTHTALPDRIESSDPANNGLVPLSGALGPRRRLIVDEEESNNGEGDTPNGHQHDRAVEQQHQAEDVNVQPMDVLTKEQEDTAINGEVLGKKRRVLADITTPMTQYGLGDPSSIADTGSMVMSQEAPPANVKDGQICDPGQSTPPVRVQQQEALDQQGSSPRRSSQQKPVRPRELQFHGPWQWQVYRKAKTQSQAPTVITMSDITSPVPTDGAPQSPRAPIVGPAAQTEFVKLFELTQSSAFYAAETCAYLPLHVHEPRYLRSRRKKTLKGQSRARHMTPIVHPVNHHQPFLALGYGNTVTPDITSPENSIVSQSHSVRSTSL